MKTNLYKAMGNKGAITIRLYAGWLVRLVVLLFSVSLLSACGQKSAEQQIASINGYIAPEGHLTKTHLYIHWPAEFTKPRRNDPGEKELVPALTLKIPVEYLYQSTVSLDGAATIALHDAGWKHDQKTKAIDYWGRINEALFIADRQIMSVSLALHPGAKPYERELPFKDDPPDVERKKLESFLSSYAVHINRNTHFSKWGSDGSIDVSSFANPPEFDCHKDNFCHLSFGLNGRMVKIGGVGEALDSPQLFAYNQKNKIAPPVFPNGVPKWHAKLDPTQVLLNSFVLPEDSPEIKGMFARNK